MKVPVPRPFAPLPQTFVAFPLSCLCIFITLKQKDFVHKLSIKFQDHSGLILVKLFPTSGPTFTVLSVPLLTLAYEEQRGDPPGSIAQNTPEVRTRRRFGRQQNTHILTHSQKSQRTSEVFITVP